MPTNKQRTYGYQYAAKFVCTSNIPDSSVQTASLLTGIYKTVVNVHNPNEKAVKIRTRVTLGSESFISSFKDAGLKPGELTRFGCNQIGDHEFKANLIHGVSEGFLIIQSTGSLDVAAVYTAGPLGKQVASIDVEHVRERRFLDE